MPGTHGHRSRAKEGGVQAPVRGALPDRERNPAFAQGGRLTRGLPWLVALAATAAPPAGAQSAIDLVLARRYFEEARSVDAADAGRLWGVAVYGPTLLVDPESRQLAANMPDSAGLLSPRDGVYTGRWPDADPIANTAVTYGGRRYAMIMWPLPGDRAARLRLLFHEQFHRIQPRLGLPSGNPSNAHLNTLQGRLWTRLEWRALAEALLLQGEARRQALRDAMAFRAVRLAAAPNAAAEEQALLLNEGVAEYTGWKLNGQPDSLLPRRVAVSLMVRDRQETFARSFAYATGPALGVLLDLAGAPWRKGLDGQSDLGEMLSRAWGLAPVDTTNVEERADRYGGVIVRAEEMDQAERRAEADRMYRARFLDGPILTLPATEKVSYSFDPNGVFPLAGEGTVYSGSEVTDAWGTLRVTGGGVLMRRGPDGRLTGVVVAAPAGATTAPLKGEGWNLELSPGWVIRPGIRPGAWIIERGSPNQ